MASLMVSAHNDQENLFVPSGKVNGAQQAKKPSTNSSATTKRKALGEITNTRKPLGEITNKQLPPSTLGKKPTVQQKKAEKVCIII